MDKPFEASIGKMIIHLDGFVTLPNEEGESVGFFDFGRCSSDCAIENRVVIDGTPENGIVVEVIQHLFREGRMERVDPYYNRNGIRKFLAQNDMFVVLTKDTKRQIYVICHRIFQPTGHISWDAGITRKLPVERHLTTTTIKTDQPKPAEPVKEPEPVPPTAPAEPMLTDAEAQAIAAEQAGLDKPENGHGKGKKSFVPTKHGRRIEAQA